jgi:hypothetical protein
LRIAESIRPRRRPVCSMSTGCAKIAVPERARPPEGCVPMKFQL